MNAQTDSQLLCAYAESRSEAAFAELVRRHVDFAYSAALRMVRDEHLAEDVTQGVFVALAKNAAQLQERTVLSGWLHRTAQNIAAQTVRTIERRRAREQEAAAMNELYATEPGNVWEHIAPHLDAALGELSEADRDALLLRYFERKSAQEMAQTLGISDEAAQKRVSRAVERLREFFVKRGVTVGAQGLVVVISANAIQAAPAGLAATLMSASLAGAAAGTGTTFTLLKLMAVTKLQVGIICSLVVAVGTLVVIRHNAATVAMPDQVTGASSGLRSIGLSNGLRPSWLTKVKRTFTPPATEPVYQGRLLSEWIEDLKTNKTAQVAHDALVAIGLPAIPALADLLDNSRTIAVNRAAFVLADIGKDALPVLLEGLTNGPLSVRQEIAGTGAMQSGALLPYKDEIVPVLVECMRHEDAMVRSGAVNALQSYGKRTDLVMPPLIDCLTDTNANVRYSAATVIRKFGRDAEPAIPTLVRLAREDADASVRGRAAESLRVMAPQRADQEGL